MLVFTSCEHYKYKYSTLRQYFIWTNSFNFCVQEILIKEDTSHTRTLECSPRGAHVLKIAMTKMLKYDDWFKKIKGKDSKHDNTPEPQINSIEDQFQKYNQKILPLIQELSIAALGQDRVEFNGSSLVESVEIKLISPHGAPKGSWKYDVKSRSGFDERVDMPPEDFYLFLKGRSGKEDLRVCDVVEDTTSQTTTQTNPESHENHKNNQNNQKEAKSDPKFLHQENISVDDDDNTCNSSLSLTLSDLENSSTRTSVVSSKPEIKSTNNLTRVNTLIVPGHDDHNQSSQEHNLSKKKSKSSLSLNLFKSQFGKKKNKKNKKVKKNKENEDNEDNEEVDTDKLEAIK